MADPLLTAPVPFVAVARFALEEKSSQLTSPGSDSGSRNPLIGRMPLLLARRLARFLVLM